MLTPASAAGRGGAGSARMLAPCPQQAQDTEVVVSILVKALNEADNIERCLRSCLAALDGIGGEVVVADSLSTDATVELAARFPVTVLRLRDLRDRGCGVGAQLAYQHCRGRYVYLIDGDMELPVSFLRQAIDYLEREPGVGGVAGQLEELAPQADLARIRRHHRRPAHAGAGPVEALHGGGLYRRQAIEEAGGYVTHPSLHAYEELELALRLRAAGWTIVRLPTVSMRHAGHTAPAFDLLLRRWRSGYALGAGELLRACWRRPYFAQVVRRFHNLWFAMLWWLCGALALAWLPRGPMPSITFAIASAAIVAAMMIRKRSVYFGLYAVTTWQVFAAGILVGALRWRGGDPKRRIDCILVRDERKPETADPATSPGPEAGAAPWQHALAPAQEAVAGVEVGPASRRSGHPYGASEVRRGLIPFMSGRIYTGVIQLAVVALFVRHMVVEQYAAYTVMGAVVGLIASLTLLGMERASLRYIPEARLSGSVAGLRQLVRVLTIARLAVLVLAVVVVLALAEPILHLLQLESHRPALWMAMLFLMGSSTTKFQRYTLQSLMLQRDVTRALTVASTTRLLLVLLIVWQVDTMTAVMGLAAMAATEWTQALIQWSAYRRHVRILNRAEVPGENWRPDLRMVARYALVNGYATSLRTLSGRYALRLIGATYLSPAAVAAFGFFQSLGERLRPYLPIFLTRAIVEPVAMAQYLQDRDFARFNRVMSVALKLNLLVIAPLAGWLALSADPAIGALTGGKFMEYSWIMLVIVLSLVSVSNYALLELTANAVGVSMLLAKSSTLAAVLTLGALAVTQPWSGVLGLVLAGMLTTLIGNVYLVARLRRAGFHYRIDYRSCARIVVSAALAAGVAHVSTVAVLGARSAWGSLLALGVGAALFAAILSAWTPFPSGERDILRRILPRRLRRVLGT